MNELAIRNHNSLFGDWFGTSNWLTEFFDRPLVNRQENDKEVVERFCVPGFEKDNLELSFDQGYLVVASKNSKNSQFLAESYVGEDVNVEEAKAVLRNGYLTVTIPRIARPKQTIKIESS